MINGCVCVCVCVVYGVCVQSLKHHGDRQRLRSEVQVKTREGAHLNAIVHDLTADNEVLVSKVKDLETQLIQARNLKINTLQVLMLILSVLCVRECARVSE